MMLIAPQGMNFMQSPPKLQQMEAATMQSGPLRSGEAFEGFDAFGTFEAVTWRGFASFAVTWRVAA
jgi:hypothetical protein